MDHAGRLWAVGGVVLIAVLTLIAVGDPAVERPRGPRADSGPVSAVASVKTAIPALQAADASQGRFPDVSPAQRRALALTRIESGALREELADIWIASAVDENVEGWEDGLRTFVGMPDDNPYTDNAFTVTRWQGVHVRGDRATALFWGHAGYEGVNGEWAYDRDAQYEVTLRRVEGDGSAFDGWRLDEVAVPWQPAP